VPGSGRGARPPSRRGPGLAALLASASSLALLLAPSPARAQATIAGGASVTVPGPQSSPWNLGLGNLTVGQNGTGTLGITSGGSVSNFDGNLGANAGSSGTVTVTGAGSSWSNGNSLQIGSDGTGNLTIDDSGAVTAEITRLPFFAGQGTLTLGEPQRNGRWLLPERVPRRRGFEVRATGRVNAGRAGTAITRS